MPSPDRVPATADRSHGARFASGHQQDHQRATGPARATRARPPTAAPRARPARPGRAPDAQSGSPPSVGQQVRRAARRARRAPLASTMPIGAPPVLRAPSAPPACASTRPRPRSRRRSRTTSAVRRTGTQSSSDEQRARRRAERRARLHDRRGVDARHAAPPIRRASSAAARYSTAPAGPGSTANQNSTANTCRYASTSPRSIASLATSPRRRAPPCSRRATRASARRAATTSLALKRRDDRRHRMAEPAEAHQQVEHDARSTTRPEQRMHASRAARTRAPRAATGGGSDRDARDDALRRRVPPLSLRSSRRA